ncbi:MAG: peptidylprolyl isomerase [Oscillospiraceae bacterium]|nr:peptidylprolyl isomerase [Oscillospiraceae bacterium]
MRPRKKLFLIISAAVLVALSAVILFLTSRPSPPGDAWEKTAADPSPELSPVPETAEPEVTVPPDPVAAYVGGRPVTVSELSTYIALSVDNLLSELNMDSIDWEDSSGDTAISDYVKKDALEILRLYAALESKAGELGISLTKEETESIENWHEDAVDALGGEESYAEYLEKNHMSEATYLRIYSSNLLYNHIYDYYYGNKGTGIPTQEEADAWADARGIFHISRIFLSTEGADSAEKNRQMQNAVNIARQLAEGADFYRLAGRYDSYGSEYLVLSDVSPQYAEALRTLDVGTISGVLEMEDGYYIVKRESVDVRYIMDHYPELVSERFNELISQWASEVEIITTECFDSLNAASVFED